MRYEILDGLPPYGPGHVSIPEGGSMAYSEGYVVRFYRSDGTDWVANFSCGQTMLKGVFEIDQQNKVIVIAYGECYIMDPDNTTPLSNFGWDYFEIFTVCADRYVLIDNSALTIVEPDGSHWHTERIAIDGIKKLTITGNVVSGLAFSPTDGEGSWDAFSYDIDKKMLR